MSLYYWDYTYAQWLFQYLLGQLNNNAIGVASLMGNLYAESAICPFRCENDNNYPYNNSYNITINQLRGMTKAQFIAFNISGGRGYSLAQWTTSDRKGGYYDFCGQGFLGDNTLSADYLVYELNKPNWSHVYNKIIHATDINECTIYILKRYEAPADTGPAVQRQRCNYARQVYDDFSGLPPLPPGPLIPIYQLFCFDQHKKKPLPFDPNWLY